jgi:L-lactate utilization protein LutC
VDFNQVMISNLMMQLGNHTNIPLEEGLFRHMVINSLRSYKQKFQSEYGEIVIACDDRNYWRKQVFPYYKANRKKNRDASEINWNQVFDIFNTIKAEIKEYFPYRVIQVESAEADDIIATLVTENKDKTILILSADKDFVQLQKYATVRQYDPIRKKWIKEDNPQQYLYEHILKGDQGDGIPNILSDDDTFVTDKRQKPMTQKKMELFKSQGISQEMLKRNFARNELLVDLTKIPDNIRNGVINKYNEENGKDRSKLFNYFISHNLKLLMDSVGDF